MSNPDGTYTYSYVVDNSVGGFPVSSWSLEFDLFPEEVDWVRQDVPAGGDVATPIQGPGGFDDWIADTGTPLVGNTAQDFIAVGPFGEGDVGIGEQLGGFSFTSARLPGEAQFVLFDSTGNSVSGTTVGPSITGVPEVSALLLAPLGGCLLAMRRRR